MLYFGSGAIECSTNLYQSKEKGRQIFCPGTGSIKKDVDKPLIAILTLNTIAHTVGAILVGVQAKIAYSELYGNTEKTLLGIQFSEAAMVGLVSTIMTILILVASEIIPKTIGATYWKQLAHASTTALKIMVWALRWTEFFGYCSFSPDWSEKRGTWKCI